MDNICGVCVIDKPVVVNRGVDEAEIVRAQNGYTANALRRFSAIFDFDAIKRSFRRWHLYQRTVWELNYLSKKNLEDIGVDPENFRAAAWRSSDPGV